MEYQCLNPNCENFEKKYYYSSEVYKYINYKFLGTIVTFILAISLYRISIFLILCITGYNIFSFSRLWMSILDSLVLNIIYGLLLQKFLERFYERRFLYSKIY